jgi:hypothetical protein
MNAFSIPVTSEDVGCQHDAIGGAMVEQGVDGRGGHHAPVPVGHSRGDGVAGGVAAGVDGHHPGEVGAGQAVFGEDCGDSVAEGGVPVDQGVVEVQHQQRHDRQ